MKQFTEMIQAKRIIRKNGIQIADNLFIHKEMSGFIGKAVDVSYNDDDHSQIQVTLPNGESIVAQQITPTSLLDAGLRKTIQKFSREENITRVKNDLQQLRLDNELMREGLTKIAQANGIVATERELIRIAQDTLYAVDCRL